MSQQPNEDHINEEDALAQAKSNGIEFVDHYEIEDDETRTQYETYEEAEKIAEGKPVIQVRVQKQVEDE